MKMFNFLSLRMQAEMLRKSAAIIRYLTEHGFFGLADWFTGLVYRLLLNEEPPHHCRKFRFDAENNQLICKECGKIIK